MIDFGLPGYSHNRLVLRSVLGVWKYSRFFGLLFFCYSAAPDQVVYPDWFIFQSPLDSVVVAFGTKETVEEDALHRYCAYQGSVLRGILTHVDNKEEQYYLRDSNYNFFFDKECLDRSRKRLLLLDVFITDVSLGDVVALYSVGKKIEDFSSQVIRIDSIRSAPTWTKKGFWSEKDYYYGVGLFRSSGNWLDAWATAEERAILSLIDGVTIRLIGISIYDDEYVTQVVSRQYFHTLGNVKIMERWLDTSQEAVYVKVRIARDDITVSYPDSR